MEIKPRLSVQQWVGLSDSVRTKLHIVFGLHRSVGAEVNNGQLVCDGHSYNDLGVITLENMSEYLGTKQKDFYDAFNACVVKAQIPEPENTAEVPEAVKTPEFIPPKPTEQALKNLAGKRRGRSRKK